MTEWFSKRKNTFHGGYQQVGNWFSEDIMKIQLIEMLDYYDFPILFSAQEENSGKWFLCSFTDDNGMLFKYICVSVTKQEIENVKNNTLDMSLLFNSRPMFTFEIQAGKPQNIIEIHKETKPQKYFFEPGSFLHVQTCNELYSIEYTESYINDRFCSKEKIMYTSESNLCNPANIKRGNECKKISLVA
ncbi:MAG: hypothetical protein LKE40_00395 [Spirochaetia bacterium]|nr:hypothetical protein [Spirochaetia bacterium]